LTSNNKVTGIIAELLNYCGKVLYLLAVASQEPSEGYLYYPRKLSTTWPPSPGQRKGGGGLGFPPYGLKLFLSGHYKK
jgi:hypothetical protein